jgi:hypothetical protein
LSDQRLTRVQFDHAGRATLTAPGRTVAAGDLGSVDIDILFMAIKLALVERGAGPSKIPVLLDDPFGKQPDAKLQLISRMLKHIGVQTQVVHVTTAAPHKALADASAAI